MQRSTASPAVPAKRSPSPAIAKLPHLGLPFSNTLYQSMLPGHNLASNAQANSALLLAQTLCNNKPLMAINNPMILGATLPVVSNANHPFNKSMLSLTSLANTTSPGLLIAAKQEASPTIPMFNYSLPVSYVPLLLLLLQRRSAAVTASNRWFAIYDRRHWLRLSAAFSCSLYPLSSEPYN